MEKSTRVVLESIRTAADALSEYLGAAFRPFWELVTNVGPLVIAVNLWWRHGDDFGFVEIATIFAAASVILSTLPVWVRSRDSLQDTSLPIERMQPIIDKLSWLLMAAVLLLSAVDATNRAFYQAGVPGITEHDYRFGSFAWSFTALDIYSLTFGLMIILAPICLDALVSAGRITKEQHLRKFVYVALPFMLVFAAIGSALLLALSSNLPSVTIPPQLSFSSPRAIAPSLSLPTRDISDSELEWAAAAIVLFILGYLGNHPTLVEMYGARRRQEELGADRDRLAKSPQAAQVRMDSRDTSAEATLAAVIDARDRRGDDELLWSKTLRELVFETVVLPPLIVGAALVSSTLDEATAAVYGVFVFSGFSVWNLSAKVVKDADSRSSGLVAVLFQLVYGFFMTVLWSIVLWRLGQYVRTYATPTLQSQPIGVFDAGMRIALAAIFVQVVFGSVYQNAWGRSLSDRWTREGSQYAIVSTVVCVGLGAMRPTSIKWIWVIGIVGAMIFVPAWALRRTVVGYILMRVRPGRTAHVRKTLTAANISSAVVYGDYDILAKVEVPGRLRLFGRRADVDGKNLGALAELVKKVVRKGRAGVIETQTLLDFSEFVPMPSIEELRQRDVDDDAQADG